MPSTVQIYIDFKSPYAYLAVGPARELERTLGLQFEWLPYTLDIPSYLGSASVDADGKVVEQNRNAHQWRRVKYSYMDCRREANRQGLTIRGPQKIFDSSIANIGLLFASSVGAQMAYIDTVFSKFWKRELDIESVGVIADVLASCGVDALGFSDYALGSGKKALNEIQLAAESNGVFGVPSVLIDERDLFWGREHFSSIWQMLADRK